MSELPVPVFYVPGEHDVLPTTGRASSSDMGRDSRAGWHSFDKDGVHFIGLVNVVDPEQGWAHWGVTNSNGSRRTSGI
jgi:hypothetical protein